MSNEKQSYAWYLPICSSMSFNSEAELSLDCKLVCHAKIRWKPTIPHSFFKLSNTSSTNVRFMTDRSPGSCKTMISKDAAEGIRFKMQPSCLNLKLIHLNRDLLIAFRFEWRCWLNFEGPYKRDLTTWLNPDEFHRTLFDETTWTWKSNVLQELNIQN